MNKLSRIFAVGVFAAFAVGCTGINGTFLVDPLIDEEIQTGDFNSWLAHEYQRRTRVERDVDMEWTHAGRLAEKGYAALNGENVQPWVPSDWNVLPEDLPELRPWLGLRLLWRPGGWTVSNYFRLELRAFYVLP